VDVSLNNAPGPPRFVPLVMGLAVPDSQLMKATVRGDMLLGGCIVTGYEAKSVWVW